MRASTYLRASDAAWVAPAVASVAVEEDGSGTITFRVAISNRARLEPDEAILIALRTDRRRAGFDHLAGVDASGQTFLLALDDLRPALAPTFCARFSDGEATFAFSCEELGLGRELAFAVLGAAADEATFDQAPARGTWTYRLAERRTRAPVHRGADPAL